MWLENQIANQLPADEKIVKAYRAFEGDIRVITEKPNGTQTRYTVKMVDGYPKIEKM